MCAQRTGEMEPDPPAADGDKYKPLPLARLPSEVLTRGYYSQTISGLGAEAYFSPFAEGAALDALVDHKFVEITLNDMPAGVTYDGEREIAIAKLVLPRLNT
jgi:hypothetical protein